MTKPVLDLENAVTVELPLRGEWTPLNTPAERVPSHGTDYFGQRYAFDFCRFERNSASRKTFLHHLLGLVKPSDCYGYGAPVHAPFDGQIVKIGEGWPDRPRLNLVWDVLRANFFAEDARSDDFRPLTGNFILLKGAVGVALLAHLKTGSVNVALHQTVKVGDLLGLVGHSGNSTLPHLHFHLMDSENPFEANGVLCKFRRYEKFVDGQWQKVENAVPEPFERFRSIQ